MLPRPSMLRALQLTGRQGKSPTLRSTLQRRFTSTEPQKLVGPMDNAFNRERMAVKHHAAESAGKCSLRSRSDKRSCAYELGPRSLAEIMYLVFHPKVVNWEASGSREIVLSYLP